MNEHNNSFLGDLLSKKAMVYQIGSDSGKPMKAALAEVDRQIGQALQGGDPIKGIGVTKSGEED